ncbi:MAG: helix-turn-helix transcriptional regulator [Chloroflexota bacterium]|nr:helix-turn-helix transcriptional regulator [Chloroflexota bacterium]
MIACMGMVEVAAYLRIVRRERGYTQESLAEAVDTSKRTIERLERAEGDITVQTFLRIVAALRASGDQLVYLATDTSSTVDEAEALARGWLRGEVLPYADGPATGGRASHDPPLARLLATLQSLEPDQLVAVLHELSRLLYEQRIRFLHGPRPRPAPDE